MCRYFSSVYSQDAKYDLSNLRDINVIVPNTLKIVKITQEDILTAIKRLKPKKSAGPDKIPPYVFKGCAELLVVPLSIIFNAILKTTVYPERWKTAKICPILKTGDKQNIKNYRPIATISAPSKIFEIYSHVSPWIADERHGFLPKRSTTTNLISFTQIVNECIDKQGQVDVVLTDFAKAFDKVDHDIMLNKLHSLGLSRELLLLLSSYLKTDTIM